MKICTKRWTDRHATKDRRIFTQYRTCSTRWTQQCTIHTIVTWLTCESVS